MRLVSALAVAATLTLTGGWGGLSFAAGEKEDVDVAIVFLVDTSYSMDSFELQVARDSHLDAITSPAVVAAIESGMIGRIGATYVEFGAWADPIVGWTTIAGQPSADAFAASIRRAPLQNRPQTGIGAAFERAAALIDTMPYRAQRVVVDIVGDGINSAKGPAVVPARNALLERGAVINGMPLMLAPSDFGLDQYYETIVIGGPGAFSMPLTRIEQMPAALREKIVLELF